jgi:hypothetical protein
MDQMIVFQKEKYLNVSFEVAKRLAHASYNMEMPAYTITWGQISKELSHVMVDLGIEPDQMEDETLIDLIEEVKVSLYNEGNLRWREIIRIRLTTLDSVLSENREPDQEPDEGVLTERFENATRLGDEDGYWVDGGASADFFDD